VSSTVPGLQISVGHRALSGEILPFCSVKAFYDRTFERTRFLLVKYPIAKSCLFNTFFINETNKKAI
jgi:hypothetical protein